MVWDLFVGYPWYSEAYSAVVGDADASRLPEPPEEATLGVEPSLQGLSDASTLLALASHVFRVEGDELFLAFVAGALTSSLFMEPYEGVLIHIPAGDPIVGVDLASRFLGLSKVYYGFERGESFVRALKSCIHQERLVAVLLEGRALGAKAGPRLVPIMGYRGSKVVVVIEGSRLEADLSKLLSASSAYHETLNMPWKYSMVVIEGRKQPEVDARMLLYMLGRLTIGDAVTESMAYGSYAARLLGRKLKEVVRLEEAVERPLTVSLSESSRLRSLAAEFVSSRLTCTHSQTMAKLLTDISSLYAEASDALKAGSYSSAATALVRASVLERSLGELMIDSLRGRAVVTLLPRA